MSAGARRAGLILGLCGSLLLAAECGSTPWGQQLIGNGDFESGALAPWQLDTGDCAVAYGPSFPGADAASGDHLLHGGLAPSGDCRVSQEIDLSAAGYGPGLLDATAAVEASAWLRGRRPAGDFDDQSFLRLRYLDAAGQELGSLRTLIGGDSVWTERTATGRLPAGTRRLRVELEARLRSEDALDGFVDAVSVVLRKRSAVAPALTKQPLLQDMHADAMTVLWETDGNDARHALDWGVSGGALDRRVTAVETTAIDATHFVHRAEITGLAPGGTYDYRVSSDVTASPVYTFRTPPAAGAPIRIAWLADNQNGPGILTQHLVHLDARDPDLLIVAGDVAQRGERLDHWQNHWFTPMETLSFAQRYPTLIARGNHDGEHALAYAYTALPGNEAWYHFRYGTLFIVVLDTEAPGAIQRDYLSAVLDSPEALAADFRIVVFHEPPFTNLWNGNATPCLSGHEYDGKAYVRNLWVPLFESKDVDLVISGHSHSYQHGVLNGVRYVIVGGGGGTLDTERGCGGSTFWSHIDTEVSSYHYALMDVDGGVLSWNVYDLADQPVHGFQIVHAP